MIRKTVLFARVLAFTVSASAGETIDGDSFQKLLSDHASETYVCDGTNAWYII